MRKKKGTIRRSGFEDKIEAQLKKAKVYFSYESEKLDYTTPEQKHKYVPDFVVRLGHKGPKIYIEAKGKWDAQSRRKMALIIAQNPNLDIRMVFMRNNYLRKGSKTTYAMWAEKNNIKYAIGEVPTEWLK